MLKREALPLYGRRLSEALASPGGDALLTLWASHWRADVGSEEVELAWEALFDVLRTRRPFRGRFDHPGFTAATFAPERRVLANVRAVSAVVLMFDRAAGVELDAFAEAWADHAGLLFTTNEHSSSSHAFVAVLPYARIVSADEHRQVVEALAVRSSREGRPFDPGTRNPARFAYLPGAIPGRPFETRTLTGTPITLREA